MLKQNLDFVAVAVIVLVLGVMQVPKLGVTVAKVAMEQKVMRLRNVRFEPPMLPPVAPRLTKPVLILQ